MTTTDACRSPAGTRVVVAPLTEWDLPTADSVLRCAFDTFVGAPDRFGDSDYVHTRFRAAPGEAFKAELDGDLVGSSFVTRWGSFGFFGPLSVRPDLWGQGVARRLLDPTIGLLDAWSVTDAGLYTFAHSAKHVSLYRSHGFWPQHLTFVTSAAVPAPVSSPEYRLFSTVTADEKAELLRRAADVTGSVLDGLDLQREILAADIQSLGDTVLVFDDDLVAFAVCHAGAGSEAGTGKCYVKFAAVRPGALALERFDRLLDACFSYAAQQGADVMIAGCNAARVAACHRLFGRGFRTQSQGVAMQRGNRAGFNRPDVYVIDDWR